MDDIDERRCPNCGRGILSWDVLCPGCDQVPWDSPAGRRVLRARRRRHALMTGGPMAGLLLLVAGVVIVGNMHLSNTTRWSHRLKELEGALAQAGSLAAELEQAPAGTSQHDALVASWRQWLEHELPTLLAAAGDPKLLATLRTTAVLGVAALCDPSSPLAPLVPSAHRAQIIDAFTPLTSAPDHDLQAAARAALAAVEGRGDAGEPSQAQRWPAPDAL